MIIFIATIFGGMTISILINTEITFDTASITILFSETANYAETIKTYFYLALGNGLLLLFPVLLQSITIGIILKRDAIGKEANRQ